MTKIKNILIASILVSSSHFVSADPEVLKFSYWDEATPPFIEAQNGKVYGGIIKDIADEVGKNLQIPVELIRLPVGRIESQITQGNIDVDCLTSPIWKQTPELYNWSPKLFDSHDRFLVRREQQPRIQSFEDLKGMVLGIYNGYTYHPEVMSLIQSGEVETIKVRGVEHGIQLLKLGRLDALIDFEILLKYQLKTQELSSLLTLAEFPADSFSLHCAYSKKTFYSSELIDAAMNNLVKSGKLAKILKRYQ